MAYVDIAALSGLGRVPRTRAEYLRLTAYKREPVTIPPPIPVTRPAVVPRYIAPPKPAIMPIRPALIRPSVTTAIRLARTKIRKMSPMWFEQMGIARRLLERLRAPSGAAYNATDVKVVAGADPVSKSITGAGAPMTGQSVSLKESQPIVAVAPSAQGITLVDKPHPVDMPLITFKPLKVEPLPGEPTEVPKVAKAGLSPIVYLIIAGLALSMLFKKKGKRR